MAFLLNGIALLISSKGISDVMSDAYRDRADNLAKTIIEIGDKEEINKLYNEVMAICEDKNDLENNENRLSQYEEIKQSTSYKKLNDFLSRMAKINEVDDIYLLIKINDYQYLYLISIDENKGAGYVLNSDKHIEKILTIDEGIMYDDSDSGWMVRTLKPLDFLNDSYIGVDIAMSHVMSRQRIYIGIAAALLFIMTVLISLLISRHIAKAVVAPIREVSDAASKYCDENVEISHNKFSLLDIHTGDEIEALSESMKKMERDMNDQIGKLLNTRKELIYKEMKVKHIEKIAAYDSLTGLRNKHAYDDEVRILEDKIAKGDYRFAVAMIDLNYLKKINDTYGHEKGNAALKNLSKILSEMFKHSALFRIGGDEFVAIMLNDDFDNKEEVVAAFEERIAEISKDESLEEWDRTSAAIGYSSFDPDVDSSYDDVFKRADDLMYQHKKQMKAERID